MFNRKLKANVKDLSTGLAGLSYDFGCLISYLGLRSGGKRGFKMVKKDLDGAVFNIRNRIKSLEDMLGVVYVPPKDACATVTPCKHERIKKASKPKAKAKKRTRR